MAMADDRHGMVHQGQRYTFVFISAQMVRSRKKKGSIIVPLLGQKELLHT